MHDAVFNAPAAIHETRVPTAGGAMLYDASLIPTASERSFGASGWASVRPVEDVLNSGGRGNTLILGDGRREFVLRHFRRGGLPGRLVRDKYLWMGEDRTRAFTEWRILQKLANLGMPVPRPAVARYCRTGPYYTADIITLRVPGIRALSALIANGVDPGWSEVGRTLRRFHELGVNHADLNAHNVQVDASGNTWLLDFDKARIVSPGTWQQQNLARLHRSLRKLKRLQPSIRYAEPCWEQLLAGYFQASRSA